jgi:teichuronic acid biosynthesis glycosyltransferase TuaG
MKNKVSIIIPFYKNTILLKKALSSVYKQDYTNYEIIVINDNNTLENIKFLKKLNKNKIKIIYNKKNLGAGLSRNKGIKAASGEYIAFLDSDDTWEKNKLSYQLRFMKKKRYLASHTSYNLVNLCGKKISKRKARNLNYKELLNSCDIGLSTVILNKKVLKFVNNFPKLKTKEDYVLWLKLSKNGIIFYSVNKYLTNWTNVPNSLSESLLQKINDAFLVYYKYLNYNMLTSILKTLILSINYIKKK